MFEQFKRDLEMAASLAPEYDREVRTSEVVNIFAEKYCTACVENDEQNKNIYYSCLLLKFWDRITKLYAGQDKNYGEQIKVLVANKQIEFEDVFNKVCECINTGLEYWIKNNKIKPAQAYINQVISSRAAGELLRPFNLKKNEGQVFQRSLDDTLSEGETGTVMDTVGVEDNYKETQDVIDIIQLAINKNKIIEAIIFDTIAFNDCQKYEKETYTTTDSETGEEVEESRVISSFWAYKLVKELNALGENYKKYFLKTYDIQEEKLDAALASIKNSSNNKLYAAINNAQKFGKYLLA